MAKNNDNFKKGQKKGGAMFPRYSLKQLRNNLQALVNKTHLTPITLEQLSSGVFSMGPKSVQAQIKYSALKQFKLLEGPYAAIKASELARGIVYAANDSEAAEFLRQAFFNVKVFKNTFETFHSATTPKTRVLGYVTKELNIHPESGESFFEMFADSVNESGLGKLVGDEIELYSSSVDLDGMSSESEQMNGDTDVSEDPSLPTDLASTNESDGDLQSPPPKGRERSSLGTTASTNPNIDIKIDPSLDPDKLEKQLAVLRKFKLI